MNATSHTFTPEEVMAYLDGELSAERTQAVSNHLESCVDCQALLHQLRAAESGLKSWGVETAPAQLDSRIMIAAAHLPSRTHLSSAIFQRTRFWSWKHWIGGLVAVTAAALLFLSLTNRAKAPHRWMGVGGTARSVDIARVNEHAIRQSRAVTTDGQLAKDEFEKLQRYQKLEEYKDAVSELSSNAQVPNGSLNGTLGKLSANQIADRYTGRTDNGPMIARTVSLAVIVKDFAAARSSLDTILARHSAYSANLSVSTPQDAARSLQASLRVPAPQLTAALGELKALGRVEAETQNGEEVTQQHADLVARLKNSRETEQRLQAILTQRTGKISDVLEVEQEIARVRGEIEQMEAEQKNLEHRVDFATIDLKISEEYKAQLNSPAPSVSTQIHNALVNGYRNVADTLLGLVLFFAEYGPVLLLWCCFLLIPAYLVWRRWRAATAAA